MGFAATVGALTYPRWVEVREETAAMATRHLRYGANHPGWSFPARVWSAPASLSLPANRLVAHARARGYQDACPATQPGEVCGETGTVVPRGGLFAEGPQPPGLEGWTRSPALEPVLVGWLVGEHAEIRTHLPLAEAPAHLVFALLAAEDDAFFDHIGVNPRGVLRAAWANLRGGGPQQGASTITMQVVRNLSQRKDRTLERKVEEAFAAVALERFIGKDAVLQMYLDAPYLGQWGSFSICGFQAAAQYYYGVDARDLSLSQAATLASILPAPGRFSPERHPEVAAQRRNRTLDRMAALGWAAPAAVAAAKAEDISATPHPLEGPRYPAYLQATRQWLEASLDEDVLHGAGLEVHTALDVVAQETTERLLPKEIKWLEKQMGLSWKKTRLQGAGALLDVSTGYLVATYGGTQELATDFSRATQARRQSGSAIKPLVYALAFSQAGPDGYPAWRSSDTVSNVRKVFKDTDGWIPQNVDGVYTQTSTLAAGLTRSQNIATARLLEALGGPNALLDFAEQVGFDTAGWREEMGLALGTGEVSPLEMARFVATVLDYGRAASGRPVVAAVDAAGVVRVPSFSARRQVLDARSAALTRDLMRLVVTRGTGASSRGVAGKLGFRGPAMGKTGTTDSAKDLWFVGGTGHYAAAVWLGYDQPARIDASASDLAAPLWGWWMRAVHEDLEERPLSGMETVGRSLCTVTGKRGNGTCRLLRAPFLDPSRAPTQPCPTEHPPPDESEKPYEGLWQRKAREKAEAAAKQAESGG